MTDIEFILDLIRVRAEHFESCASTLFDTDDWPEKRVECSVQYETLKSLAAEISASLKTSLNGENRSSPACATKMWILVTEMGGTLNTTLFNSRLAAVQAEESFCKDFRLDDDNISHAACDVQIVSLSPRRLDVNNEIDGRFVSINQMDGRFDISFHETLEKAEIELEKAEDLYGEDGWYVCQPILVPTIVY